MNKEILKVEGGRSGGGALSLHGLAFFHGFHISTLHPHRGGAGLYVLEEGLVVGTAALWGFIIYPPIIMLLLLYCGLAGRGAGVAASALGAQCIHY